MGWSAGEGQEHVIEGGLVKGEVDGEHRRVHQRASGALEVSHALVGRNRDAMPVLVDGSRAEMQARQCLFGAAEHRRISNGDVDSLATKAGLELGWGSFCDYPAVVDNRDVVGEAVGFFEILGGEYQRDALGAEV